MKLCDKFSKHLRKEGACVLIVLVDNVKVAFFALIPNFFAVSDMKAIAAVTQRQGTNSYEVVEHIPSAGGTSGFFYQPDEFFAMRTAAFGFKFRHNVTSEKIKKG